MIMDQFGEHRVYPNQLMMDEVREWVPRTWKERLFTLPWRPLISQRLVIHREPSRKIFKLHDGSMVMHPALWAEMKKGSSR